MKENWILETQAAPLQAVQNFMIDLWEQENLDYMLLPIKNEQPPYWQPQLISDPAEIYKSNPFAPLMIENAAKRIPAILQGYPDARIAVFLRPCEMRALDAISAIGKLSLENIITISSDCLGTFPESEYNWRIARKGTPVPLDQQTVQFARQGGLVPYRYRSSCQTCSMPIAQNANINIGVIGLPARQYLIISSHERDGTSINLDKLTNGLASNYESPQHQEICSKVLYRRKSSKNRLTQSLIEQIPVSIENLIEMFHGCRECQICFDCCPISEVILPQKTAAGWYTKEEITEWLTYCVECGICEQDCPENKPLTIAFSSLRQNILGVAN